VHSYIFGRMVELADTFALRANACKGVPIQIRVRLPNIKIGKGNGSNRFLFHCYIYLYMRKYRQYTDSDVLRVAAEVKSVAGFLRGLGLKQAGGNYAHGRKTLQRLNVDTTHWTGQGWSKDKQLKDWSDYSRVSHLKKHLIKIRGRKCERCKNEQWLENPIGLEVHHIDGDRTNNDPTNLKLLCGNCHYQTPNFRNRK